MDTNNPEKILTIEVGEANAKNVKQVVEQLGFKAEVIAQCNENDIALAF